MDTAPCRFSALKLPGITALALLGLSSPLPLSAESRPFQIAIDEVTEGGPGLHVQGPSGDYRIEVSGNLTNWSPLEEFFLSRMTGGTAHFTDPDGLQESSRFYRAVGLLIGAAFHLEGRYGEAIAQALLTAPPAALEALGISFAPLQPDAIPSAGDLASADRDARVYAAAIAALSLLAETIDHESRAPGQIQPLSTPASGQFDPADLAQALVTDLSSGKLDGTDGSGNPVAIGATGVQLPAHDSSALLQSLDLLKQETADLEDISFGTDSQGNLTVSLLPIWNTFHWNSSDWR